MIDSLIFVFLIHYSKNHPTKYFLTIKRLYNYYYLVVVVEYVELWIFFLNGFITKNFCQSFYFSIVDKVEKYYIFPPYSTLCGKHRVECLNICGKIFLFVTAIFYDILND
jgi:hypothetical protein